MRIILKVLLAPVTLVLSLFTWLCIGLISCTAFLFQIASSILVILAVAVALAGSVTNGLIVLLIAFLVSPLGIPLLAVKLLEGVTFINNSIKNLV